ncbi:MAG TPA: preprotein translocase subunit SecG, partial [Thermoanaerobaculia bacterium]|nr:preprotein translocase subunit SecG [Thermoanaerobaculia bacterium]
MTILSVLVTLLHVVVAVFLILVVLLQQGKGADLAVFGGGSTQAAFGARGAATLFHKLTVAGFVVFTLTTISMAVIEGRRHGTSVMGGVPAKTAKAPAAAAPATTPPA